RPGQPPLLPVGVLLSSRLFRLWRTRGNSWQHRRFHGLFATQHQPRPPHCPSRREPHRLLGPSIPLFYAQLEPKSHKCNYYYSTPIRKSKSSNNLFSNLNCVVE